MANEQIEEVHHEETVVVVCQLVEPKAVGVIASVSLPKLRPRHFVFFPPKSGVVASKEKARLLVESRADNIEHHLACDQRFILRIKWPRIVQNRVT